MLLLSATYASYLRGDHGRLKERLFEDVLGMSLASSSKCPGRDMVLVVKGREV